MMIKKYLAFKHRFQNQKFYEKTEKQEGIDYLWCFIYCL